jgi:hypothetical protein
LGIADVGRAVNIDYKPISDLFKMNGLNYNNLSIISLVLVQRVKRAGRKIGRGWKRGLKRFRGNRELANFLSKENKLITRTALRTQLQEARDATAAAEVS